MAVVLIKDKVTPGDLKKVKKEHGDVINLVADVETSLMTIGGELHADGEQLLLNSGSNPEKIWGGSIDLITKRVDPSALINVRPDLGNDSQEILDPEAREKFIQIVRRKFGL